MSGWFFYRHPLLKKSISLLNVFTLAMTMVLTGLPAFSFKGDVRPAAAAPVVLDNRANPNTWVANAGVFASATATDGTTYIGGNFTYVGPNTGGGVPISTVDGTRAAVFPKVSGTVYAVISDGAGGWYIGGDFTKVGAYTRTRLAHILSDGSVDPAWSPSANNRVRALAKIGSTVYAGGDFLSVNGGTVRWRLAAFDVTTGAVTSWMESGGTGATVYALAAVGSTIYIGGSFVSIGAVARNGLAAADSSGTILPWNPNATGGMVQALAVDTGTVYAGGSFTTVNGGTARSRLAAFDDATGTVTSWNPAGGAATNSNVYTLLINGSLIFVGGAFTALAGSARNYLGAISKGGAVDSWSPNANNAVTSLVTDGANVYAGGYFTTMQSQARNHLAAISLGNVLQPWNPNSNGSVAWALARSGSTVFAGGDFTSINGVDRNRLAALDASGSATSWNPNANSTVYAMTIKDSNVYVGGSFTTLAGGGYARSRVAAVSTTGTVTGWNPNVSVGTAVYTLASDPTTSTIYVGGSFSNIAGQGQANLAGLDPTTGAVISGWFGASPNSNVRALRIAGAKVYVAGAFTVLGGQTRNYLGAINLNGTLDTTWNPNPNSYVYGLGAIGSTVYAGGAFTTLKSGAYARNYLAAFDVSTDTPLPWNPGANSQVNALTAGGSTVYAGGFFTTAGGKARNYLAAFDAVDASGAATSWNPSPNSFGNYSSINAAGSSVFVAGDFATMNGETQGYFARFDPDVLPPNTMCAVNPAAPNGDNGWYKGPAPAINLTPDESGTTYYQWDTSTPGSFSLYGAPLTPAQGSSDLYYYSADGNNNTETVKSQSLKVDPGLPTDPSVSSPTHTTGTVTNDNFIAVDLSGATDPVSGVAGFGTSWTNGATATPDATVTLPPDATSTVSGSLGDGTWWFNIRTKDNAGNWTNTVHLGPFGVDASAPSGTVQIEGGAQFTNNSVAELNISSLDAFWMQSAETTAALLPGTLYKLYNSTDTVVLTAADGPKTVFTQFKDLAGNESTPTTDTIILDTGLPGDPDTVLSTSHTTGTPSNDKTIDMTFSDPFDGLSGVEGYAITFSEGTTELPLPPVNYVYTGADSTTSPELNDGTWWFNLRTKDRAGNWTSTVHVGPYLIEADPPVTTIEATPAPNGDNGWYKNNPAITFTTNESATTYYSWDDSASVTTTFTAPLNIPSDGEHELFYRSVDIASNEETAQVALFKLDPTAPVDPDLASPTHATDTPDNSNTIQIDIAGATDPVSGVEGYSVLWSPDSTTPPPAMNLTASGGTDTTTSAPLADGTWWFNLSTKDMAGNWTNTAHIGPFVVDTSAPVSFFTGPANGSAHIRPHDVYISGTATDPVGSGLADTKLSIKRLSDDKYWDGGAWGPYAEINVGSGNTWDYNMPAAAFTQSGAYLAAVQATDLAGNTQGAPSMTTFYYLDGSVVPSAGLRVLTMDNSDTIAARVVRTNTGPFDPTAADLSLAAPAYPADTTITVELNTGGRNALAVLAHGDPLGWEQNGDTLTVEAKTIAYKPTTATPAFDLDSALEFLVQYSGDPALQDSWFASNASQQNVPVPDLSDLDSLRLQVTGVGGVDGWAKAFLPTATLAAWDTTASLLSIEIDGVQTTPTITPVAGGALVDIQLGYSTHTLRYGEDRVPPSGAVAINHNDTHANSTLIEMTIDATDGVGSGVAEMRFAETTTALAGAVYQPQDTTATFNLDPGDGTRTVYAQFKDAAGNESAPAADTIILDTTGPSGSVAINGGAQYANDQVVDLNISSPDAIFMRSAETTGALLIEAYKVYNITDSIVLTGADGTKTVFTQFKDIAGNESTPVADNIILDTNAPDESGVLVASTPATGTPTNDNTVDVDFSGVTDAVSGVAGYSVLFDQSPATAPGQVINLVGSGGSTTETISSAPLSNGAWYAHISSKDNAGNWTSTVHVGPFSIDTASPSGTVIVNNDDTYTTVNNVTLSLSATDTTGSGVAQMRFAETTVALGGATYTSADDTAAFSLSGGDGPKTVYAQFKDAAGNESAPAPDGIYLDSTAPSATVSINAGATFTNESTVSLDISAADAGSGPKQMRFAETTSGLAAASYQSHNTTASFNLTGADGGKTVYAQFKDVAGNESGDVYVDAITLDTSAPVDPTVVSSSGHATDTPSNVNVITMALSDATDLLSGVEGFSAEWSTDTPVTPDNTVDLPASASSTSSPALADGDWYFNLRTKDNAGNWTSTVHKGPFKIDKTKPANPTSAVEDGGAADNTWQNLVSDPAFTVTGASDTSGSGIKSFRYYFGTNAAADPTDETSAGFYNPAAVENPSVYYLRVKTEDNAGNISDAATLFTFKYDAQAPTDPTIASPSHTAGGWSSDGTIDVNLSGATDGSGSGIDGYSYSFTAGPTDVPDQTKEIEEGATSFTSSSLGEGAWYAHLRTKDNAGNWTSTRHIGPFRIDKTAPSATVASTKISTNESKTKAFNVSWSGADSGGSGIASYDVQVKAGKTGAWTNWKTGTAATSAVYTGSPGKTAYFRARATDGAGNTGAYSGESKTIVPFDNNSLIKSKVGFGSTVSAAKTNYYLGTARYSTKKGDEITYVFTGDSFSLIGNKGPKYSKAEVTIDGVKKTIDAKASSIKFRQALFTKTWTGIKKHTVKIKNLGTAGRTRFDIDALAIGK